MTAIFLPVWIETLILLREGVNTHQISIKINATYSHVHKIRKEFEKKDWIRLKGKQGRERVIEWTPEGKAMYLACKIFYGEFMGE